MSVCSGLAAYELSEQALGTGGSATVRRAQPRAGGPCCAVKALRKEHPAARRMASNEAEIMQALEHPSICKLLDSFEDADNFYLVLEYIEGHELFEECAGDIRMGESRAAAVMRQLLVALQHCHARGVVHRDLKPENVMIQACGSHAEPSVKLVDFGLAARDGQRLFGLAGTRPYLAPEALAREDGICSPALDMWSLGIVLYTCLLGEMPPAAVCAGAQPVLEADAWRTARVSAAAKDLVSLLLQYQPLDRPTAAEALQHPWLQSAPVVAVPAPSAVLEQPAAARAASKLSGERSQWQPGSRSGSKQSAGLRAGASRPGSKQPVGRQVGAVRPGSKESVAEPLLGWAFGTAPLEHVDALLGCVGAALEAFDGSGEGSLDTAAGRCLEWLDAAAAEVAGNEALAAPAFAFSSLLNGCCAAQEGEAVEVLDTQGSTSLPAKKQRHYVDAAGVVADSRMSFGADSRMSLSVDSHMSFGVAADPMFGL